MSAEWPTVANYPNEIEAEMAQGALQSEGIAAIVWKDDAGGMYPSIQQVEGVAVRVAPEDLEQARRIIDALAQTGGTEEGDEAAGDGATVDDEEFEPDAGS